MAYDLKHIETRIKHIELLLKLMERDSNCKRTEIDHQRRNLKKWKQKLEKGEVK